MKPVTINILERHTTDATRNNHTSCMVAQAIKDQLQLPDDWYVSVGYSEIQVTKPVEDTYERAVTWISPSVRGKISAFDRGSKVKPFSVDVNIPE